MGKVFSNLVDSDKVCLRFLNEEAVQAQPALPNEVVEEVAAADLELIVARNKKRFTVIAEGAAPLVVEDFECFVAFNGYLW